MVCDETVTEIMTKSAERLLVTDSADILKHAVFTHTFLHTSSRHNSVLAMIIAKEG
jgi:hypothetical protein